MALWPQSLSPQKASTDVAKHARNMWLLHEYPTKRLLVHTIAPDALCLTKPAVGLSRSRFSQSHVFYYVTTSVPAAAPFCQASGCN